MHWATSDSFSRSGSHNMNTTDSSYVKVIISINNHCCNDEYKICKELLNIYVSFILCLCWLQLYLIICLFFNLLQIQSQTKTKRWVGFVKLFACLPLKEIFIWNIAIKRWVHFSQSSLMHVNCHFYPELYVQIILWTATQSHPHRVCSGVYSLQAYRTKW